MFPSGVTPAEISQLAAWTAPATFAGELPNDASASSSSSVTMLVTRYERTTCWAPCMPARNTRPPPPEARLAPESALPSCIIARRTGSPPACGGASKVIRSPVPKLLLVA
jgi:hypothetical protein